MSTEPRHVTFFATPAQFRRWLEKHHASETELWVGYYKRASGRPSLTWQESVDEALCFGWIDGIRKSIDENSYANRFTPRKRGSIWSAVNTKRAKELIRDGRMSPAGLEAFKARDPKKSDALEERRRAELDPDAAARFKRNRAAWSFFEAQPPGYRRIAIFYVMSAKKEETRARRLATLIDLCAAGRRLEPMGKARAD